MGESRGRGGEQGGRPKRQNPSPRGCRATGAGTETQLTGGGARAEVGAPRDAGHQPLAAGAQTPEWDFCRAEELALQPAGQGTQKGLARRPGSTAPSVPVLCRALSTGDPSTKARKQGAPGCVPHQHPCLRPGSGVWRKVDTVLQPLPGPVVAGAEQPQALGWRWARQEQGRNPARSWLSPNPSWAWEGPWGIPPCTLHPRPAPLSHTWAGNPTGSSRSGQAGRLNKFSVGGLGGS